MVIGLDSARKQLQWRLIYATSDTDLRGFTGYSRMFRQRSGTSLWTETDATTKAGAANHAEGIRSNSQTGPSEGQPIFAQRGNVGQHAHRRLDSKAAGLPHDRRSNSRRRSDFVWQTRARIAQRPHARA